MPEELGVEAAQRAGAGALVLGLRESSTKRRAVTDGAIRASEFCMVNGTYRSSFRLRFNPDLTHWIQRQSSRRLGDVRSLRISPNAWRTNIPAPPAASGKGWTKR